MEKFEQEINRFNSNSYKWDVSKNELPMWVADMDFRTAPVIINSIKKRAEHGVFGYNTIPNEFYEAIVKWWSEEHQLELKKEWVLFCTGVVPAISSLVRKLSKEGDNVVVLSPVYNIFYNSISNNNRRICTSDLIFSDGDYKINFEDLEEKIKDKKTSLLIFCNPHNPIGKIWSKNDLEKVGKLCSDNNVVLISDEIHCDLTFPGKHYIPFYSLSDTISENIVMCCSPSKAFNTAGIQTSAIVVKNKKLRKLVTQCINADEIAEPNTFAVQVAISAFIEGKKWLDELREYLYQNRKYLENFIKNSIPEICVVKSEATYLAWIDCSNLTTDTTELCEFIRQETGLYVTSGMIFGKNGQAFIRLNYATNMDRLKDGLERLLIGINRYKTEFIH